MKKKKRILCLLLTFAITLGAAPAMAFAEETQESKCSHVHDESCGYREEQDEIPCDQNCTDTDGDNIVDHTAQCSYAPAVEAHSCDHVHDETCGGLPADDNVGEESEPELIIPCSVTEGCILEDGHEGDCVLEDDDTFENNSANVPANISEQESITPQANNAKASSVKYTLVDDGNGGYILTFSGEGEIQDYPDHQNSKGWYDEKDDITKIVVKEGITYIGDYALSETAATELVLPSTVEEISDLAFYSSAQVYNCLESITIPEENQYYKVEGNLILTKYGKEVVTYCSKNVEIQEVPEGVEKLKFYAFDFINATEIKLPSSLKVIESRAFNNCIKLKQIVIPNKVETIGSYAFGNCSILEKIEIDKEKNSISGSPWNVPKGERAIIWLR